MEVYMNGQLDEYNSCRGCKEKYNYIHHKHADCYIPKADFYVVSTDSFMSGWGYSQGKDNICVVPCNHEEVDKVYNYVLSRNDQKRVRINTAKPRNRGNWLISNLSEWKDRV